MACLRRIVFPDLDAKNCNPAVAAESSFLFKSNFGEDTIHNVYRSHLVSRRRIPMTACPSYKLTQVDQSLDEIERMS